MCGRYTLRKSGRELRDAFDLDEIPELEPRYNIAPTQESVILRAGDGRRVESAHWGFTARSEKGNRLLINARAETVADKPSFRDSFAHRRCLVPADGFYEWRSLGGHRLPHHFAAADGAPFAFGGLWKPALAADGKTGLVFTLLTVEANELVAEVHPRMPLILPTAARARWLDERTGTFELAELMRPWAAEAMVRRAVSRAVNNVANDSPACLAAAGPPPPEQLDLLT